MLLQDNYIVKQNYIWDLLYLEILFPFLCKYNLHNNSFLKKEPKWPMKN